MKAFIFLLSIATLIALTSAAIAFGYHTDDAFPGKCVISPSVVLDEGDVIKDPHVSCGRVTCGKNGRVEFHSCGVTVLMPTCTFGELRYPNEDYPKCCERSINC